MVLAPIPCVSTIATRAAFNPLHELRGFAPIGMLEYWNYGIMGFACREPQGRAKGMG
jgi:hypothetical protein